MGLNRIWSRTCELPSKTYEYRSAAGRSLTSEWRTPPASRMSTVSENSKSLMSPRTITLAFGSTARSVVDEVVDDLCLAVPSDLAETGRWLCRTEERLVVGLRAEVVDDDEQLLAASSELADEGLSCVVERR